MGSIGAAAASDDAVKEAVVIPGQRNGRRTVAYEPFHYDPGGGISEFFCVGNDRRKAKMNDRDAWLSDGVDDIWIDDSAGIEEVLCRNVKGGWTHDVVRLVLRAEMAPLATTTTPCILGKWYVIRTVGGLLDPCATCLPCSLGRFEQPKL